MSKEIIIKFDNEGNSTIETQGFKGKDCTDASEFIEKSLGKKTNDKKKREYYQKNDNKNKIRRRR